MRPAVRRIDRLQRLAVFDAAARRGSFTSAADELGMTQPAVTRHVRALERSLGVDLFIRTANRSELTDAGRRFRDHVSKAFDAIEDGLAEIDETTDQFVLAAHPGVVQMWLMQSLDEVQEALGDVDLRLWLFEHDDEIAAGSFDAAIRVGDGTFPGCDSVMLFPEVVVPIATPALADEYGLHAGSSAHDVYRAPLVHVDDGDRPWMTWSQWLQHFGIALRRSPGRVLFHNYPMAMHQALLGRGVALGWRPLIDDYIDSDALRVVGPEVRSSLGYYMTWPAGARSPAVDALVNWLTSDPPVAGGPTTDRSGDLGTTHKSV
jgi:DNA-binding transcriptional LysR family regulator